MPEEPTSAGSPRPAEPLERRIERLEQENRWWRGGLIAVLALVALMLLAGHHRARIDVVVTAPPWALRMPYWGYGSGPYPPPPRGWGGVPPGEGVAPGRGPRPPAPQSSPE